MPLWRSRLNTTNFPEILFPLLLSKAADMAHLCVPPNQELGVCRRSVPDIPECGTHRGEDLVDATNTSNTQEAKQPV